MTFFKIGIGNFVEKNDNFLAIFLKKCQVFGNFLTVKWQFSGGSDHDHPPYFVGNYEFHDVNGTFYNFMQGKQFSVNLV